MSSSSRSPVEGGDRQQWVEDLQGMVVDNEDDVTFLDIISSSSSASADGSGHEAPAATVDEDDGHLLRFEVPVRLMARLVSMQISPTPIPDEDLNDGEDDGDTPTSNNNVDPPVLDYPCPYLTCYWRFPSHAKRIDHIANFHRLDEETAPMEWYRLDPSNRKNFLSDSEELELIQEILEDEDFDNMDI